MQHRLLRIQFLAELYSVARTDEGEPARFYGREQLGIQLQDPVIHQKQHDGAQTRAHSGAVFTIVQGGLPLG